MIEVSLVADNKLMLVCLMADGKLWRKKFMSTVITIEEKDNVFITIKKDGQVLTVTENEWKDIYRFVERECYYKKDVIGYLDSNGYQTEEVLKNQELMDSIVSDYAELRFENNGGDPDSMMDWEECLDEVIEDYADELSEYLI